MGWAVDPNDELGTLKYEVKSHQREIESLFKRFNKKPISRNVVYAFVSFLAEKEYANIPTYMVEEFLKEVN